MNPEKQEVNNPYQPPRSDSSPPLQDSYIPFYAVSKIKFFILFVSTFSFYAFYWFWKNWTIWRQNTNSKIWPIPRAIFSIFFTHSLFEKIHAAANKTSDQTQPPLLMTASIYVISQILFNFMDKIEMSGTVYLGLSIIFIGVLAWTLWQAQRQANIAADDAGGHSNSEITVINYVWIILGILFWLLIIIGSLDPTILEVD